MLEHCQGKCVQTDNTYEKKLEKEIFTGNVQTRKENLPFAFSRASSSTDCFVCLTIMVSKRASSTSDRRRDGYPFCNKKKRHKENRNKIKSVN